MKVGDASVAWERKGPIVVSGRLAATAASLSLTVLQSLHLTENA